MSKHKDQCPNCGRFVEDSRHAEGFYDRLQRESEPSWQAVFCNESCADQHHQKRLVLMTEIERARVKRLIAGQP